MEPINLSRKFSEFARVLLNTFLWTSQTFSLPTLQTRTAQRWSEPVRMTCSGLTGARLMSRRPDWTISARRPSAISIQATASGGATPRRLNGSKRCTRLGSRQLAGSAFSQPLTSPVVPVSVSGRVWRNRRLSTTVRRSPRAYICLERRGLEPLTCRMQTDCSAKIELPPRKDMERRARFERAIVRFANGDLTIWLPTQKSCGSYTRESDAVTLVTSAVTGSAGNGVGKRSARIRSARSRCSTESRGNA